MWNLEEAVAYYQKQGAPGDQSALVSLLREVQSEQGGGIPKGLLPGMAQMLNTKESYLLAVIKRIPSLKLAAQKPVLELCAGPNCPKRANLAGFVEKTYGKDPKHFTLRYTGCMRMCGKGPNLKWDGKLHHKADEPLLKELTKDL
jgi:NADH:ubiquinone oxidoreductase subunit E